MTELALGNHVRVNFPRNGGADITWGVGVVVGRGPVPQQWAVRFIDDTVSIIHQNNLTLTDEPMRPIGPDTSMESNAAWDAWIKVRAFFNIKDNVTHEGAAMRIVEDCKNNSDLLDNLQLVIPAEVSGGLIDNAIRSVTCLKGYRQLHDDFGVSGDDANLIKYLRLMNRFGQQWLMIDNMINHGQEQELSADEIIEWIRDQWNGKPTTSSVTTPPIISISAGTMREIAEDVVNTKVTDFVNSPMLTDRIRDLIRAVNEDNNNAKKNQSGVHPRGNPFDEDDEEFRPDRRNPQK